MEQISLEAARVNKNLTQEELANLVGFSRSTIIKWEKDPTKMTIGQAEKICTALGVNMSNICFARRSNNETKDSSDG